MRNNIFTRLACCLFLLSLPLMARATRQVADDVVIDGEKCSSIGVMLSPIVST